MLYTLKDQAAKKLGINNADVTDGTTKYYSMSTLDTAIRGHKSYISLQRQMLQQQRKYQMVQQ